MRIYDLEMAKLILESEVTLLGGGRPNGNTGLSNCNVWTRLLIITLNYSPSVIRLQTGLDIRCF